MVLTTATEKLLCSILRHGGQTHRNNTGLGIPAECINEVKSEKARDGW